MKPSETSSVGCQWLVHILSSSHFVFWDSVGTKFVSSFNRLQRFVKYVQECVM